MRPKESQRKSSPLQIAKQQETGSGVSTTQGTEQNKIVQPCRPPFDPPHHSTGRDRIMNSTLLGDKGKQICRWIENAKEPDCPVQRNQLTFGEIQDIAMMTSASDLVSFESVAYVEGDEYLLFPPRSDFPRRSAKDYLKWNIRYNPARLGEQSTFFVGLTGPGVIDIQMMGRQSHDPHISDICATLYSRHQRGMESLKHIYASNIINTQTGTYLYHLYNKPDPPHTMLHEHGSKEYYEIMGTRIGRTVAYIVLSGLDQGSHYIKCIISYVMDRRVSLRFDLAPKPRHGKDHA